MFTNIKVMCYNFRVKSKALFTISLCAVCAAAGAAAYSHSSAYAATDGAATHYPEIFTEYVNDNLEGLTDFATDGQSYAFADRNRIVVVENGERTKYEIKSVSAIDYANGTYYYKLGSNSYSLPSCESANYEFSSDYSRAIITGTDARSGDYKIVEGKAYFCTVGSLSYTPLDTQDDCLKFKVYNNTAYAFMQSAESNEKGNTVTVKKLEAENITDVNPSYIDFKGTKQVSLGTIKTSLATFNSQSPHFVTLNYGSYYTEININNLSGDNFEALETYKCGDEGTIPSDEVMLALGETGNAKIFTYGGKCYITLSASLKSDDYTDETCIGQAEFENAYINAPDWIYSSPHLCTATKGAKIAAGDAVKVTGKVSNEIVGLQFYKVELGEGEAKTTGYVLSGLLRPYTAEESDHPDDKNFGVIKDPDYSEEDVVKITVLLLIVIALVLIGLSYITYVLTSKKHKMYKQIDTAKTDDTDDKKEDKKEE